MILQRLQSYFDLLFSPFNAPNLTISFHCRLQGIIQVIALSALLSLILMDPLQSYVRYPEYQSRTD